MLTEPVLIVCGSRKWQKAAKLFDVLDEVCRGFPIEIWHGGADGADTLGGEWAWSRYCHAKAWCAQWSRFGKSAGFKRSAEMISAAPEGSIVVAFVVGPLKKSRGTAFTVHKAKERGLRVVLVEEKPDAAYSVSHPAPGAGEHRPHPVESPSPGAGCE